MNPVESDRYPADHEVSSCLDFLAQYRRYALVTHLDPDGDALGSVSAVAHFLGRAGKNATVYLRDKPIPQFNHWQLPLHPLSELIDKCECDALVVLDTGSLDRAGFPDQYHLPAPCLSIDHHLSNTMFGTVNCVKPGFCSTTELLYCIFKETAYYDNRLAEMLLFGILYDTYYFQTENTDALLLARAFELEKKALALHRLKEVLFKNADPSVYRIWGKILTTLETDAEGKLVIAVMPGSWTENESDERRELVTEGFINHLTGIRNADLVIFIKDFSHEIKCSVRSRIGVAAQLAAEFGGGGHANAAGFRFNKANGMSLESLTPLIREKALNYLT